jgi:hypothetical protein
VNAWKEEYNTEWPHSALHWRTLADFAQLLGTYGYLTLSPSTVLGEGQHYDRGSAVDGLVLTGSFSKRILPGMSAAGHCRRCLR